MPEVTETQSAPEWAVTRVFLHILPGFDFTFPTSLVSLLLGLMSSGRDQRQCMHVARKASLYGNEERYQLALNSRMSLVICESLISPRCSQ